jgi:hypothetical protein
MTSAMALPTNDKIDWINDIYPTIREVIKFRKAHDLDKPSLRGMFYILISKKLIIKSQRIYKRLKDATADARKKPDEIYNEKTDKWEPNPAALPIDCFADDTRAVIGNYADQLFKNVDDYLKPSHDRLANAKKDYAKSVPRWYKQPNYVEVWVEKAAMTKTFQAILKNKDVIVVPNHGWSSIAFMNDNATRLMRVAYRGINQEKITDENSDRLFGDRESKNEKNYRKLIILYFGDMDPSGEKMDQVIRRDLIDAYRVDEVEVIRVAVTQHQVDLFGLPTVPPDDKEAMSSLHNDNNRFEFMMRHRLYHRTENGEVVYHEDELFAIQLETMEMEDALEWFTKFVQDTVDGYFDQSIYDQAIKEAKSKKTIKLIRESVRGKAQSLLKLKSKR